MYDIVQTMEFERWHRGLRDSRAIARVTTAVERLQMGLAADFSQKRDIARARKLKDEYDVQDTEKI